MTIQNLDRYETKWTQTGNRPKWTLPDWHEVDPSDLDRYADWQSAYCNTLTITEKTWWNQDEIDSGMID